MPRNRNKTTLSRAIVLDAAIELADELGIGALTIRHLADRLGVGPMTIYHHVPSKEEMVDGMVEIVFVEIEEPPLDIDWKTAMRQRYISVRNVLNRHPWAAPLMESRTALGPAGRGHLDTVVTCLQKGGLSLPMTAHAYAILDSFVYGFVFEEATLPSGDGEGLAEIAGQLAEHFPVEVFPHLAELTVEHVLQPGYDFGDSFEFALDLIIEGLDRATREGRETP